MYVIVRTYVRGQAFERTYVRSDERTQECVRRYVRTEQLECGIIEKVNDPGKVGGEGGGGLTYLAVQLLMKINPQRNYDWFLMRVQSHVTVYV